MSNANLPCQSVSDSHELYRRFLQMIDFELKSKSRAKTKATSPQHNPAKTRNGGRRHFVHLELALKELDEHGGILFSKIARLTFGALHA